MTRALSLTQIASELYAGSLEDFVSARNRHASAATDAALAAEIRELRKPSVAAWVVNVFAAERGEQLAEALELAEQLREAQDDLDARALSRLGRDRRALTARLAAAAADLAETRGERVTDATRDSVQQTLTAAFFDEDAAAAVSSGRLVRALEPQGTFSAALETIIGGGPPVSSARADRPVDEVTARRRRRDAERALRDAQRRRERAAEDAAVAERRHREAVRDADALTSRAADLEKELAAVRHDTELSRHAVERAEETRHVTADRLVDAQGDLSRAEDTLEKLG